MTERSESKSTGNKNTEADDIMNFAESYIVSLEAKIKRLPASGEMSSRVGFVREIYQLDLAYTMGMLGAAYYLKRGKSGGVDRLLSIMATHRVKLCGILLGSNGESKEGEEK